MDNNNITVQANLDTTQLKKDLEKFKGEINLTANTKEMQKQIDTALKDASKNASISFKCNATGLNTISSQVGNAKSQFQDLQQEFTALPNNHTLNISVNSSGLQQYTAQLEKALQLSNGLNTLSLHTSLPNVTSLTNSTFSSLYSGINNSVDTSALSKANSEGKDFAGTLTNITNSAVLLSTLTGLPAVFKGFSESFD